MIFDLVARASVLCGLGSWYHMTTVRLAALKAAAEPSHIHKSNNTMTNANNNGNIDKVMAVHEQQKDDLLELYTSFINSYDGSADAFENSEPFMKDLFHSDFTFLTEDGPRDMRWYRDFAESFASRPGSSARVTHIERTGAGIRVTIVNVVAGVELDPITYDGTAVVGGDGRYRIRYFEPVRGGAKGGGASHMENVGRMVARVKFAGQHEPSKR